MGSRRFVAFAARRVRRAAMTGCYVLSFQVYLALPLETRRLAPSGEAGTIADGVSFAVTGLVAIAGQLRNTAWCRERWSRGRCLTAGLVLMGRRRALLRWVGGCLR